MIIQNSEKVLNGSIRALRDNLEPSAFSLQPKHLVVITLQCRGAACCALWAGQAMPLYGQMSAPSGVRFLGTVQKLYAVRSHGEVISTPLSVRNLP